MKYGYARSKKTQKERSQMEADLQDKRDAEYDTCQKNVRRSARACFKRPAYAYTSACQNPWFRR